MQNFNPINTPLRGVNLIEASAGTGKTYTISTLVVRLILEQALSIKEILVVTFTEAATEELRDRVLKRLQQAHQAVLHGHCDDDTLRDILLNQAEPALSAERLNNALRGFDEAPIFTIHGFCQRMLQENAFESGAAFDTELITSQQALMQEICEDFWRMHFYSANNPAVSASTQTPTALFVAYVLDRGYSPQKLLEMVSGHLSQPLLTVIPEGQTALQAALNKSYVQAFQDVQDSWPVVREDIKQMLLSSDALNRRQYALKSIPQWCALMDALLMGEIKPLLFDKFERFCSQNLSSATKKNKTTPEHVFFDLCQQLQEAAAGLQHHYEQHLLSLKFDLFKTVRRELTLRKRTRNQQSFDDLLMNLYQGLQGERSEVLAQAIRRQYRAALIDEFQDTDPLQYAIFHHLFNQHQPDENKELTPTSQFKPILFFIGDPKQAIYSFRGADIFTYLKASSDADQQYTLGKNYRSHPRLIQAINRLFADLHKPFLLDKIAFYPVDAAKPNTLLEAPPLRLWHISRAQTDTDSKLISKAWAEREIPGIVASEIVRLLHSEGTQAGDIAVLVRTNRQAQLMQAALQMRRVPSVLYSRDSVFNSPEVNEVLHLLAAIIEPAHEARLRTALATELLGIQGHQLDSLSDHEQRWESWLLRFRGWHDTWQKHGFIRMFRGVLLEQQVPARLLNLPDGERRLTNVLHLGEVLQQASRQPRRGPLRLYKWLTEQVLLSHEEDDSYQLRLESDAAAVKLVTIHKSKGLEYPIVFLPFAWDGQLRAEKAEQFSFHREDGTRILDLGSPQMEVHRQHALLEERAENLRLLYVALTRAQSRCYLLWGAFKDAQTSALGYLLHQSKKPGDTGLALTLSNTSDEDIAQDLQRLVASEADNSDIQLLSAPSPSDDIYSPPRTELPHLHAKSFQRRLGKGWQLASFTALVAHEQGAEHQVDIRLQRRGTEATEKPFVQMAAEPEHTIEQLDMLNFPAGAQAGNLLHDIFEHLDFQHSHEATMKTLIHSKLQQYGFEPMWGEVLFEALQDILHTPLDAQTGVSLSDIPLSARLNELEFYYPLNRLEPQALYAILLPVWQQHWPDFRPFKPPHFDTLQGFMRGFIDLVFEYQGRFYVLDYKSNFLGQQPDAYHQSRLLESMQQHHYLLQYHIYTVALHRYLQQRLPNYNYAQHFGGVYYLFLRGMKPDWGATYGVFCDKPDESLIEALASL